MIGSAAVSGSRAVIALGLALSIIPRIAPGAIDGFLVGTVLSAACCLLLLKPGRILARLRWRARDGRLPGNAGGPAAPADLYLAAPTVSPFGEQAADGLSLADLYGERARLTDSQFVSGSRHGLAERAPLTWQSLVRPSSPRHAAPSPFIGTVAAGLTMMAAKFTVRPLPVRN